MKLAIMQPYFFPYIGYWQLINTVDRFIVYDDVNYIKRGWINRNRILIDNEAKYITIPLVHASQYKLICDHTVVTDTDWRNKILRTIELNYKKSEFFHIVFPELKRIIQIPENNLSAYLANQLQELARLLSIRTEFISSSDRCYKNNLLSGQERILDICIKESADTYVNMAGGRSLYRSNEFADNDVKLRFLESRSRPYHHCPYNADTALSIVDILMNLGFDAAQSKLSECDLS